MSTEKDEIYTIIYKFRLKLSNMWVSSWFYIQSNIILTFKFRDLKSHLNINTYSKNDMLTTY